MSSNVVVASCLGLGARARLGKGRESEGVTSPRKARTRSGKILPFEFASPLPLIGLGLTLPGGGEADQLPHGAVDVVAAARGRRGGPRLHGHGCGSMKENDDAPLTC